MGAFADRFMVSSSDFFSFVAVRITDSDAAVIVRMVSSRLMKRDRAQRSLFELLMDDASYKSCSWASIEVSLQVKTLRMKQSSKVSGLPFFDPLLLNQVFQDKRILFNEGHCFLQT